MVLKALNYGQFAIETGEWLDGCVVLFKGLLILHLLVPLTSIHSHDANAEDKKSMQIFRSSRLVNLLCEFVSLKTSDQ